MHNQHSQKDYDNFMKTVIENVYKKVSLKNVHSLILQMTLDHDITVYLYWYSLAEIKIYTILYNTDSFSLSFQEYMCWYLESLLH